MDMIMNKKVIVIDIQHRCIPFFSQNIVNLRTLASLDSQCGPGRGVAEVLQQRLRALQQRSSLRVEEIKARRALAKVKPEIQGPSEAREKSAGKASPPGSCKANRKSEPQQKPNAQVKAELHPTTEEWDIITQKKTPHPPPGILT